MTHLANSILTFIRRIEIGEDSTFPNDPDASDPDVVIPDTDCWRTSGATNYLSVYVAAFDADGRQVAGVTATVDAFYLLPSAAFGLPEGLEVWHAAGSWPAHALDEVIGIDAAAQPKMGVRLTSITDATNTAVSINIAIQQTPGPRGSTGK